MNCQEARKLVEDAVDNNVVGSARRRLDLHLMRCRSCREFFAAEKREHAEWFDLLNDPSRPTAKPPVDFVNRLVARARAAERPWYRRFPRWGRVAAIVLVCVGLSSYAAWTAGIIGSTSEQTGGSLESLGSEGSLGAEGTLESLESEVALESVADSIDPNRCSIDPNPDPIVPKDANSSNKLSTTENTEKEETMNIKSITKSAAKLAVGTVLTTGFATKVQAEWRYDASSRTISDGNWTIPVTWTEGSDMLTINKGVTGSGALDLWDLTVDGTPITALSIAASAFRLNGLTTLRANHIASDLQMLCAGSTVQSVDLAGEGVTALLHGVDGGNNGCFDGCKSLVGVRLDFPNLKTIGKWAFLNCSNLATPIQDFIPRTVTEIGEKAFSGCSSMGGDLWIDSTDAVGPQAFRGAKINSVHLGGGNFAAFTATDRCGTFESSIGLTNVYVQAETLDICNFTFLGCSSLTHATFDVKGAITMSTTDRAFQCASIQELAFTGSAPAQGVMDNFLAYRSTSAGEKPVTVFASKLQNGWTDLAAQLTTDEEPVAPEGCFGVYRDGSRKAWLCHRASPYDAAGGSLVVRPSIEDVGTPSIPYGTYDDLEDGTVLSVEPYFLRGTTLYRAMGYVVETYDSDNDVWTEAKRGTDLSWTYHASPDVERITWQFREAGFTLTLGNVDVSGISLDPAPVFANAYLADTVVSLTANDSGEASAASFVRWYGDLAADADPEARTQTVEITRPLRLAAAYRVVDWTLSEGVLSDGLWRFNATFDAETGALHVTQCLSGEGLVDWRDIAVNGVAVTSITLAEGLFAESAILREFHANKLTDPLTRTFHGSAVEVLDLAGEAVTSLRPAAWSGYNYGFAEGCGQLKSVRLDCPNLKTIGNFAFLNCSNLVTPIQDFIPRTVTEIGERAFGCCSSMGGDLWLDSTDAVGPQALWKAKIDSVHLGGGNFAAFTATGERCGTFEKSIGLTNVYVQAETLDICNFTFLDCPSLTHATFDVKGAITMSTTDRAFPCASIRELVFTGPAPTQGVMDNFLVSRSASAGEKPVTVFASKNQPGWKTLAAPLSDAEKEIAPARCFGVYREESRKAWLVHRTSPYDPSGMMILVR